MAEQCYLGIDLGAESGRVMAALFDGSQIRLEEVHRFANGPVNLADSLRWDVLALWSGIQNGLEKAASRFGESVVSVGVDTWGVDYVLFCGEEMLSHPFHYRDSRTRGLLPDVFSQVAREEIFAGTGVQFMEINTLYQLLALQHANPRLLETADHFLMMPDFFHWCLSGSRVVEFTDATTTQCFHPARGEWAYDLLRRFSLPTAIFPEVVSPGTKLGTLRNAVAERTGLGKVPVVAPATHDTAAAVAAVPTEHTGRANWAYISSGTWSLMGLEVQEAVLGRRALELNVTNEGGVDNTYRLLKNIMGLWLVQQCRHSFERQGRPVDYEKLMHAAEEAPPFRSLVDPDDTAFLNPEDMPSALQQWCRQTNQPVPETEGPLIRCALESLALKYRKVLEWLEELAEEPVEVIHIVGGGTQNELLNQFTADACRRPVVTGPVEATALGNVLVQLRTSGGVGTLAEMRAVVRNSYPLKRYEPAATDAWDDAYQRFSQLLGEGGSGGL